MKTRNGFVSNSSSSSFVVALDRPADQLTFEYVVSTFDVGPAKGGILFDDLRGGQISPTPKELCPHCKQPMPEPDKPKTNDIYADEWYEDELADICKFIAEHPGLFYYALGYSDNDGPIMSELEHGSHWDHVPHIRFSHH